MRRSFKYRIYPYRAQATVLDQWLDLCRELHNAAVEERREAWKGRITVSWRSQRDQLPDLKKLRPDLGRVHSQVVQHALERVELAFRAFFRRVRQGQTPGYPRFKSRDRYRSVCWPQATAFRLEGTKKLWLSGIGLVRIKLHRPVGGRPKTCTVVCEAGKWFASFSCDGVEPSEFLHPIPDRQTGLDVGLESFATLSSGEKIQNPRWYRKTREKIAQAQRDLSRKKRGSRRRAKSKHKVARLHEKARHQRQDFQFKLAHRLVSENGLLAVEDLDIKDLVEKSRKGLATSIQDAAWGSFLSKLAGKAEEAGRRLVRVPPAGTSSTCWACGAIRRKELSERLHQCPCGVVLSRDLNAALNILRLGRSLQASA